MTDSKNASPLARSVLALDIHFSELIRLGHKINDLGMKSDSDFEQAEKLMKHFAEHGEGVASEVVLMSQALNDARAQAESAAKLVAERAEQLQTRRSEEQKKMEAFRLLGEKVRDLTVQLSSLKAPENAQTSVEDQTKMSAQLSMLETQLQPLIR